MNQYSLRKVIMNFAIFVSLFRPKQVLHTISQIYSLTEVKTFKYFLTIVIISGKCAYYSMYSGDNIDERNCTSSSHFVCPEQKYRSENTTNCK